MLCANLISIELNKLFFIDSTRNSSDVTFEQITFGHQGTALLIRFGNIRRSSQPVEPLSGENFGMDSCMTSRILMEIGLWR